MKYADLEKMIKNEKDGIKRTAEYIGVTEQKLMDKLKGRCPLFVSEVYMICALFNIQNPQEKQKFFYPERPKNGTQKEVSST